MTKEEMKKWIDNANYTELLRKWRFAPSGDPFFRGEIGDYYKAAITTKRREISNSQHVAASKAIGCGTDRAARCTRTGK